MTKSDPTPVRVGQIWQDNDKRGYGRQVRIVEIVYIHIPGRRSEGRGTPHAIVELVTGRGRPWSGLRPGEPARAEPGRRTRIRLDRFRPTSTGYRLIQEGPGAGVRQVAAVSTPVGPDCPDACTDDAHVANCPTLTGRPPETDAEYERLYGQRHQDVTDDSWLWKDQIRWFFRQDYRNPKE